MNNLKPCPFCGGIAELKAPGYEHYSPCWCKCTRCGAEGPTKSSELEAKKGWNERAQDDVEHASTVGSWISVKDKLPTSVVNKVLVWLEHEDLNGYLGLGHYEKYKGQEIWYDIEHNEAFSIRGYAVTHWMPLPEPPKEGKPECD